MPRILIGSLLDQLGALVQTADGPQKTGKSQAYLGHLRGDLNGPAERVLGRAIGALGCARPDVETDGLDVSSETHRFLEFHQRPGDRHQLGVRIGKHYEGARVVRLALQHSRDPLGGLVKSTLPDQSGDRLHLGVQVVWLQIGRDSGLGREFVPSIGEPMSGGQLHAQAGILRIVQHRDSVRRRGLDVPLLPNELVTPANRVRLQSHGVWRIARGGHSQNG